MTTENNSIIYLKGDATSPQAKGIKIIAHISNDVGGWGKGFVLALSKRWKAPEQDFRAWYKDRSQNDFALGKLHLVQVEEYIYVASMIAQHGLKPNGKGVPPIRYEALAECLTTLTQHALELNASVHMPRIGCGLSGGKWEKIEPMIQSTLLANHIRTYVYDYD